MTGSTSFWVWVAIIGAIIGLYWMYKQGKIPWLKGIKLPRMLEPKAEDRIAQLKAQTEREATRNKELQKVRDAKRELAKARAESNRLRKEIDGISAASIEKEEDDAAKPKQRRL